MPYAVQCCTIRMIGIVNISDIYAFILYFCCKSIEIKKTPTSTFVGVFCAFFCDRDRIQTYNLLIRSQILYSVELRSLVLSKSECKDKVFFVFVQIYFKKRLCFSFVFIKHSLYLSGVKLVSCRHCVLQTYSRLRLLAYY